MSTDTPLPNVEAVTHNTFVVRTQAGFRQALKAWGGKVKGDTIHDWPTAYPSLVTFTVGYCGYHYVQCTAIHLNTLMPVVGRHA